MHSKCCVDGFVAEMNPVTKMMVALGLTDGKLDFAHYVHIPPTSHALHAMTAGSTVLLEKHMLTEHVVHSMSDITSKRFVSSYHRPKHHKE